MAVQLYMHCRCRFWCCHYEHLVRPSCNKERYAEGLHHCALLKSPSRRLNTRPAPSSPEYSSRYSTISSYMGRHCCWYQCDIISPVIPQMPCQKCPENLLASLWGQPSGLGVEKDSVEQFTWSVPPFGDLSSLLWTIDERAILSVGFSFLRVSTSSAIFPMIRFGLSSFTLLVPTCRITLSGFHFKRGLTKSSISSTCSSGKVSGKKQEQLLLSFCDHLLKPHLLHCCCYWRVDCCFCWRVGRYLCWRVGRYLCCFFFSIY